MSVYSVQCNGCVRREISAEEVLDLILDMRLVNPLCKACGSQLLINRLLEQPYLYDTEESSDEEVDREWRYLGKARSKGKIIYG